MCKLPKPPASRALCQAKRAPRAAFPGACLAAQAKRWAEGIRVPGPLAGGGSTTARGKLRLCPASAYWEECMLFPGSSSELSGPQRPRATRRDGPGYSQTAQGCFQPELRTPQKPPEAEISKVRCAFGLCPTLCNPMDSSLSMGFSRQELAREGAGCGSVGDVPGAWLASAPLWPSLWT